MARQDIAAAVAAELVLMGVRCRIEYDRRHPRVLWEDVVLHIRGIVTVPGSAGDRRSLINNTTMARRLLRQARLEAQS